jgi:DNA-binding response OmpR family regulator
MSRTQVLTQDNTTTEPALQQIITVPSTEDQTRPIVNSGKKILLVDDEPVILELVETFLIENGFIVNSFRDGFDAVHCFVNKQHDLVLTDINMPGISGIILADYIKSQDSEIPVLAMTGNDFFIEGLFDEVINKPFDLKMLLEIIQSYFMADCLHN